MLLFLKEVKEVVLKMGNLLQKAKLLPFCLNDGLRLREIFDYNCMTLKMLC